LTSYDADVAVPVNETAIVGFVDELLLTVIWPIIAPAVDGLNVSVTLVDCPGFKVTGRLIGDIVKPVPVTATEFTVTAAVPLDVSVTLCVVGVLITTLPNEMLLAFRLNAGVAALSCSETPFEVVPVAAVTVADCAVVTDATLAVKVALEAVAGTNTVLGTVTEPLLLVTPTLKPPVGAEPERLTLQESASAPVIDVLLQEIALTVGATAVPVPLRLTIAVGAVLAMLSCPVTELAPVG
jgi:hypothetical protein